MKRILRKVVNVMTEKNVFLQDGDYVEVRVPDAFLPFCLMLQYLYTGVVDVAALPYKLPEPYGPSPPKQKNGKVEKKEKEKARLRHALYGADFDLLSQCIATASRYKLQRMLRLVECMLASRKMLSPTTCTRNLITASRMGLQRLKERSMLWAIFSIDGQSSALQSIDNFRTRRLGRQASSPIPSHFNLILSTSIDFVAEPSGFKALSDGASHLSDELLQRARKLHESSIYAAEAHYDLTEAMSSLSEEAMRKANEPLTSGGIPWTTIGIFLFGLSLVRIMPALVPVLAAIG